ncbi:MULTISPECIES: hypothetical protein [Calothrix]|uniref:Uncharacterized protein n=2 Tax=Calothrix TaxID=1186 RepID=A0ABR8AJR5_9CYAN|nr:MULTISPECIES: hypothetical protein [Calothrix]MBD2200144.1 hypothetical protein [Calothrix parietina FACHB-288]MBD2229146.1 hypothetical protein [Calothrix anomala FACHB-343]
MSTAFVTVTRSGTNFVIDVTAANLLTDLSIKDFVVFHDGVSVSNSSYTKTTPTTLTYTGTSIPSTVIQVRRKTPNSVVQTVSYGSKFSSSLWNSEMDRSIRRFEEYDLNISPQYSDIEALGNLTVRGNSTVEGNSYIKFWKKVSIPTNVLNDFINFVIPLHQRYTSTALEQNYCIGNLFLSRGASVAYNRSVVLHINTASAYTSNTGGLIVTQGPELPYTFDLATFTYQGTEWIGIRSEMLNLDTKLYIFG